MTERPSTPAADGAGPRRRDKDVRSHFGITVGGVSLAYCYIRKNACSAFKRLFMEQTDASYDRAEWRREIEFMAEHHGIGSLADLERHDHRVLVLRDPVERYVSAFVSLMIAHTPPPTRHLRKRGSKAMGVAVEEASFELFLAHQLPADDGRRGRIDKHFWPQAWHLAPTTYTDVIDIERLAPAMKALIGKDLGARYFDRPVNATAIQPTYHDPAAATLPARVLRARFRESGQLPDKASFLAGGREAVIRAAYAEDDALHAACRAHDPAQPMTLRIDRPAAHAAGQKPGRKKKRGG